MVAVVISWMVLWGRMRSGHHSWLDALGTDDVWVDVIMVLARGCSGAMDEVWVHEIMALAHGCSEGQRSGWT